MNTPHERLRTLANGLAAYTPPHQPYYIVAPAWDENALEARVLHGLCSVLNQAGYEAWVDAPNISGTLWTPPLTPALQRAHCLAHRHPIVLWPERLPGNPLRLGLSVCLALQQGRATSDDPSDHSAPLLLYKLHATLPGPGLALSLPCVDTQLYAPPPAAPTADTDAQRNLVLVYSTRYSGPLRDHAEAGCELLELSPRTPRPAHERAALYQRARVLYAYDADLSTVEARLCGCPVVLVPNPQTLPEFDPALLLHGAEGLAWGLRPEALQEARATLADFRRAWLERSAHWKAELAQFIEHTQQLAQSLEWEQAWPQPVRDRLPSLYTEPKDQAARADRLKWERLHTQYPIWCSRTSPREIDATLYAEHLVQGRMQALVVLIDQRASSPDRLADTLDALFQNLSRPELLVVVADHPCPPGFDELEGLLWFDLSTQAQAWAQWRCPAPALVLVESGSALTPQALAEWGLVQQRWPQAQLVYADEDVFCGADAPPRYPYFKPDPNLELLRCCNYLGSAVWVRSDWWNDAGKPLFDGALYAQALELMHLHGRERLAHIDRVLVHSAARMDSAREAREFDAASAVLERLGVAQRLRPLPLWGTWLALHRAPEAEQACTLVVPSGAQTGYLRALLQSLSLFPEPALREVLVVCHADDEAEISAAVNKACTVPVRLVLDEQAEYVHARRLNLGVAQARTPVLLVCDDDTEPLHPDWLKPLLAIVAQTEVGCVAPRLISSCDPNPKVVGGPAVLGLQGAWGPYNGEEGHIDEAGVYSRLQLTQDVGTVGGHFFVFKRAHWEQVAGFDEQRFGLFFGVLDFCLRLSALGLRHVWTPLAHAVHHGGKTLEVQRRDSKRQIELVQTELAEREALLQRWSAQLARDPNYNRHLSLLRPYDIESDIVIDWEPARHERARILSTTITSGSGQYRIIDPLHELQDAGLAQTCVVLPMRETQQLRLLQPVEVARSGATTLVLQHSVDDAQMGLIPYYRLACPELLIVQMVDDLFGEVPEKHPNRVFHSREGHQRIIRAIQLSDRLVVTTEPLRQHYQRYVDDVRIVPNTLRAHWFEHYTAPSDNAGAARTRASEHDAAAAPHKLRVGWVGAGQHQGDLEMIAAVVEATAHEFDWVFMGMCIERIRAHIKEMHSFVSIADYPAKMATLKLDIAIAPIEDNIFNRCKSNLRLLEYGAMGWPVVCSDVYPYHTDAPPVLHCPPEPEAWIVALRRLAADAQQRAAAGRALHQWVRAHYRAEDHAQAWLQALTQAN